MDRLADAGSRNVPRTRGKEDSGKTTNYIITMESFSLVNSYLESELERISLRAYSLIWDQPCQISVRSASRAQASAVVSDLI